MFAPFLAAALLGVPSELGAYVRKADASAGWKEVSGQPGYTELRLTSQTWQGKPWLHDLVVAKPRGEKVGTQAILFITGDRRPKDLPLVQALADQAGVEVAVLFDVPNQPLWGLNEDALIAKTFGEWMKTKDPTWPLLFPMTKSAIKAMDAVQQWSKGRIKSFVVTGASKRGWTTWLTAATKDKRIKGIAPMVIDVLNMPKQLVKQREMFGGKYSEQIEDYSSSGLTELLTSPDGRKLTQMVDPYSYLPVIKTPVLVLVGGNDRYWTVDAHSLYWKSIRGPKLMRVIPNVGHDLGDGREAVASIAFFTRALFGKIPGGLPKLKWQPGDLNAAPMSVDRGMKSVENWVATSKTFDFRDSNWMDGSRVRLDGSYNTARFLEYQFESGGLKASFTSGVVVKGATQK